MTITAENLLSNALTNSTQKTYQRGIKHYSEFIENRFTDEPIFPASENKVILFIAYCFENNFAPATVLTYVSALGYYHKIRNLFDPTQNFVIKKCLQGYQKLKSQSDIRKPITSAILKQLITSLNHTTNSNFIRVMLRAMYLVAFYGMLRLGELTSVNSNTILHVEDVKFVYQADISDPVSFELQISGYRHSKGRTVILLIEKNTNNGQECPVSSLKQYLNLRGSNSGPLFSFMDGSPVTRAFFTQQLSLSLNWAGCNTKLYKTHSFRIGRATDLASQGFGQEKYHEWEDGLAQQ